jgi:hypothetical protein
MRLKVTSFNLDPNDMKALERIARQETKLTGSRFSASTIVRRLIKAYLRAQRAK